MMKRISTVLLVVLFGLFMVNIGIDNKNSVEVSRIEYKAENEEDINIGKLYLDNVEISAVPEKGSNVEFEKGDCNGAKVSWNEKEWSLSFDEITGEVSCSIYFKTKKEKEENDPTNPSEDPKNPSEESEKTNNPETGVFFSFVIALIVIGISVGVIYYGKKKAKFRRL